MKKVYTIIPLILYVILLSSFVSADYNTDLIKYYNTEKDSDKENCSDKINKFNLTNVKQIRVFEIDNGFHGHYFWNTGIIQLYNCEEKSITHELAHLNNNFNGVSVYQSYYHMLPFIQERDRLREID